MGRSIANTCVALVSLGTCKVYAPSGSPRENLPLEPTDRYGEQKLALEAELRALLDPRLTIVWLGTCSASSPAGPP